MSANFNYFIGFYFLVLWASLKYFIFVNFADDLDELEVYGADTKGTELASYSFEVRGFLVRRQNFRFWPKMAVKEINAITLWCLILLGVWQFDQYWSMFVCGHGRTSIPFGKMMTLQKVPRFRQLITTSTFTYIDKHSAYAAHLFISS